MTPNPRGKLSLPKGTVISCPFCQSKIATITVNVHMNDVLKPMHFSPPLSRGTIPECDQCLNFYVDFDREKIHTEEGWLP